MVPLLNVEHLTVAFDTPGGQVTAVEDVSAAFSAALGKLDREVVGWTLAEGNRAGRK